MTIYLHQYIACTTHNGVYSGNDIRILPNGMHRNVILVNKESKQGTRGIFIDMSTTQAGYLVYLPGSRQMCMSNDVHFHKNFRSITVPTHRIYPNAPAFRPGNRTDGD